MASLRQQKEAFVTGHAGTSVAEVSALSAAPVALLLLWRLLQPPAASGIGLFHGAGPTASGVALEVAVLVLPQVACLLGLASPGALLGSSLALGLALLATQQGSEWQERGAAARRRPLTDVLRDALSAYRACLMLLTCIAILGVDFHAFPRRYAKAESFGTGLMDAGVGSFVAASGLAHGFAAAARRAAADGAALPQRPGRWRREGGRVLALLALGLARLLATSAADYQHHASEYGAHWNFFLTLAALRLLSLALPWCAAGGRVAALAGAAALAAHQYGLSAAGLIRVVHSEERGGGLLAANKEGLLSLPGYWALQLLGTAAGHAGHRLAADAAAAAAQRVGPRLASRGRQSSDGSSDGPGLGLSIRTKVAAAQPRRAVAYLLAQIAALAAALWLAYSAVTTGVQPVSRRACNAAYTLWMLALNWQTLALFLAAELLLPGALPHLVPAVSGGMLLVFLAANLATGGINLAINTLKASDTTALALVSAYMAALSGGAVAAHRQRQPS